MVAEYIVKIKSDASALEKTIKEAQGMVKRINDDEVLIKFNYDGNAKEFNKVFQSIVNKHPELTVQLQYDLNKQYLEKQEKELERLQNIRMSLDPSDMDGELTDIDKKISKVKGNIELINDEMQRLSSLSPGLKLDKSLDEAQESSRQMANALNNAQDAASNMASSSGINAFAEGVSNVNSQLEDTKKNLEDISNLGEAVQYWKNDKSELRERYTPFNSKTKEISTATLVGTEEEISGKLVREAIEQAKIAVDGFIHTHPERIAAFSDDDIKMFYKLAEQGITKQVVTSYEQALSIDMAKVDLSKADQVVAKVKEAYDTIDSNLKFNMSSYLGDVVSLTEKALKSVQSDNPATEAAIQNFIRGYSAFVKTLDETMSIDEYITDVARFADMIAARTDEMKGLDASELEKAYTKYTDIIPLIQGAVGSVVRDRAQQAYQEVIKETFSDKSFLKKGVGTAIKLESLAEFIDFNTVGDAARQIVQTAEQATAKAQKSSSASKVAEKLGEYWTEGYAEGIVKHKDEIEDAIKELIKTGQLTMIDLFTDQKNIMSEDQYAPLIDPIKNIILSSNPALAAALSDATDEVISKVSPSQTFDNEIQKNLTYLENYKNTIKEIDRLKLEPETEETKKKLEELNDLAKFFVSNITSIRSENGHEISPEMMKFGYSWADNLRTMYTGDQLNELFKVAHDNAGLAVDQVASEYSHITEELKNIESHSESTRQSLAKDLVNSKKYAQNLAGSLHDLVEMREELNRPSLLKSDRDVYEKDVARITEKYPEILALADKLKTWDSALKFTKSDEWNDFLATLPQAHAYLESIGYDFEKVSDKSDEVTPPELFTESSGQLSFVENLAEAESKLETELEDVSSKAKEASDQISGQLSLDFEKATESAKETADSVEKAADGIKSEGEAAKEAAKEKEDFTKANEKAAESGKDTSKSSKEAADGISEEGAAAEKSAKQKDKFTKANKETAKESKKVTDAVKNETKALKENADLGRWLKDIQSGTNTVEFGIAIDKEMADAEFKKIAPQLAESFNEQYGTNITTSQVTKAYKAALKERQAAEEAALQEHLASMEEQTRADNEAFREQLSIMDKYIQDTKKKREEADKARTLKAYDEEADYQKQYDAYKNTGIQQEKAAADEAIAKTKELEKVFNDAESAATKSNKEATSAYNNLSNKAKEYYDLLKQEANETLTGNQQKRLDELKQEWNDATRAVGKYADAAYGTEESLSNLSNARKAFNESDVDVAEKYSIALRDSAKRLNDLADSGKYMSSLNSEMHELAKTIEDLIKTPIDLNADGTIAQIASIEESVKKAFDKTKAADFKKAAEVSVSKLDLKITEFMKKNTAMGREFREEFENLKIDWDTEHSLKEVQELADAFTKLEARVNAAGEAGRSFGDILRERITGLNAQFLAQYFSWQDWIRYIRELSQNVIGIDSALTELRKVSDASAARLQQNFKKSSETALELGQSIQHVINVTADWARLGYDVDAAEELARVTALFTTVGDNMTADDASSYLISTLQGFHKTANEAESIIDVYNEVANNFAIDTAGIGEALKRSAASFDAANTSLEKSVALVTATNTVVQDPSSVGTLWKTLSARIRGAKTELEELGEEEDEFTQTTSKLRDMVKALTGFDIMENENEYKDIYEIILGIGKEWDKLSDIEQASLGEALAGKRNANALFAVLNNIKTLEDAYDTAKKSANSAAREQENYAKSVQYSLDRWQAAVEQISYDLLDSKLVKGVVEGGVSVLDILDKIITRLDSLPTLLAAAASAFALFKSGGVGFDFNNSNGNYVSLFGKTLTSSSLFNKSDTKQINAFIKAFRETNDAGLAFQKTMYGASKEAKLFVNDALKAGQGVDEIAVSMKKGMTAGKAFSTTLKGIGSSLLSIGANLAITVAISAVIEVISKLATAEKDLAERTRALADEYDTAKTDMGSYKEEISELYEVLTNQNASYEDSKDAREKLMKIQDELISKYGAEKGAIENITAAIDGEIDALDRMSAAKWQEMLNSMNDSGDTLVGKLAYWFNTEAQGYENQVAKSWAKISDVRSSALGTHIENLTEEDAKILQEVVAAYDDLNAVIDDDIYGSGKTVQLYGSDMQQFYQSLLDVQSAVETLGGSDNLNKFLKDTANNAKDVIENYGTFGDLYIQNEKIAKSFEYSKAVDDVTAAVKKYKDAYADGFVDEEEQSKAVEALSNVYEDALANIDDEQVKGYIERLYPDVKSVIDNWQFELNFSANVNGAKDDALAALERYKKANGGDVSYEELKYFNKTGYSSTDERVKAYVALELAAEKAGVSIDTLLDKFKEENELVTKDYQSLVDRFGKDNVETLSAEDLAIALTVSDKTYGSWESLLAQIELAKKAVKEDLKVDESSIVDSVKGVNTRLKDQFDELGNMYQNIFYNDKGFTLKDVDNEQLEALRKAFLDLEDEDGNKIGVTFENGEEAVNKFIDTLTSAETKSLSLADQQKVVQDAFNDLATAYFYSAEGLEELNDETKDALKQQFQKMGITNADEVIEAGLAVRKELDQVQEDINKLDFSRLADGASEALEDEKEKLASDEFNLPKVIQEKVLNGELQSKFGNVDMNKRSVIHYNQEVLDSFEEALKSWKYYDDKTGEVIGSYYDEIAQGIAAGEDKIDTVWGTKDKFQIDNQKIEIAFTPIMVDENGKNPQFLSEGTVTNYIDKVLAQADKDVRASGEKWSQEAVIQRAFEIDLEGMNTEEIDSQGRVVGEKFVHGMIAQIGDSDSLTADVVSRLLHFAGEEGAYQLAGDALETYTELKQKAADGTLDLADMTAKEISVLENEGIITSAAAQSIAQYALQKQLANGVELTTSQSVQALADLATQAGIDIVELKVLQKIMQLMAQKDAAAAHGASKDADAIQANVDALIDEAMAELREKMGNIHVDFSVPKDDAKNGGKDAADAYVEAYKKEKEKLQSDRDAGLISESEYLEKLKVLIDKFFKDRAKYAKNYIDEMKEYLDGMKSLYDSAISGITTIIDKKIDAANKGKDAAVKALEKEKEAAEEAAQAQIDAIQAEIDKRQEQVDAIQAANEARDHEMALQKAQYELERSLSQRTRLVKYMPTNTVMCFRKSNYNG